MARCRAEPEQPVQLIDVRDLADFLLRVTAEPIPGIFNAVGPATPVTYEEMLTECRDATGGRATVHWGGDSDGFIVQPKDGSRDGTFQLSFTQALAAGLRLRPLAETVRDTISWADRDR